MREVSFLNGRVRMIHGDCREAVAGLAEGSLDACVCDPPYALVSIVKRFGKEGSAEAKSSGATGVYKRASSGFMGKAWDTGEVAFDPAFWAEVCRVLKPGAHLVAFGGTRSYHRLACAIEDAGFEVRDQIGWAYGSGFPKSHNLSKAIDRAAGAERKVVGRRPDWVVSDKWRESEGRDDRPSGLLDITEAASDDAMRWEGWGTALKPAWEPIILARKPLIGTVAQNVQAHGTGALNIDGCRVEGTVPSTVQGQSSKQGVIYGADQRDQRQFVGHASGRWPANIVLSYPEDQYALDPHATDAQRAEVYRWLSENP